MRSVTISHKNAREILRDADLSDAQKKEAAAYVLHHLVCSFDERMKARWDLIMSPKIAKKSYRLRAKQLTNAPSPPSRKP